MGRNLEVWRKGNGEAWPCQGLRNAAAALRGTEGDTRDKEVPLRRGGPTPRCQRGWDEPIGKGWKGCISHRRARNRAAIQLWDSPQARGSPGFSASVVSPEQLASCRWALPAPAAARIERSQRLHGAPSPQEPMQFAVIQQGIDSTLCRQMTSLSLWATLCSAGASVSCINILIDLQWNRCTSAGRGREGGR